MSTTGLTAKGLSMELLAIGLAWALILLYVCAVTYALVQISKTDALSHREKWVWAVAVIVFPFIAALLWFIAGPHPFGLRIDSRNRL